MTTLVAKGLVATLLLAALTPGFAHAGADLNRILNYMFMDFSVPMKTPALLFDFQREPRLTRETPIGQTFTTGPNTGEIARIRLYLASTFIWMPGEGAELTLWESPEKKTKLGSRTLWHKDRVRPFNQLDWDLNVPAKPNTSYYFELTYAGEGDGWVGLVGVMNGTDACLTGQGYLNGREADFDLCFQLHSRRGPDPKGNLRRMFSKINLDYTGLEDVKKAVESEDFETAVAKTVDYFEHRRRQPIIRAVDVPRPAKSDWAQKADALMDANWHDERIDMEGFGTKKILCHAYLDTGEAEYAKKMNDLLVEWFINDPPPSESAIGGHPWDSHGWASLSVGSRIGAGFLAYSYLHTSPAFTTDCRMAYIISLADHCETLLQYGMGGEDTGNWGFTQNSYLLQFAMNYPEFRNSPVWQKTAIDRLRATIDAEILPDGVEEEAAPGYEGMAYDPLARIVYDDLILARGLRTPFSAELRGVLERQAEHFMHIAMPNGVSPYLGDWGHDQARDAILRNARRFNRKDMLYVASAGREGEKPKERSKLYPCSGMVTMRSDWGDASTSPSCRRGPGGGFEDARYLMLHGVHFGGHGHQDLNGISALYAYGRELLSDPGSHVYGDPRHALLTQAVSHNLMTIDGEDQDRSAKTALNNWSTTPIADYISSYVAAYKGGDYTREVFYIRANGDPGAKDYYVVRDTAGGTGTHSLEQRWHFVVGSGLDLDPSTLGARTTFIDGGNLAIIQVDPSRLGATKTAIDTWHGRDRLNEPPARMPTLIYKTNAALPAAIDTVLFPFEGRTRPGVDLKVLETSPDGLNSAFKIVQGKTEDLFIFQAAAGEKCLPSENVSFDGERLFVRRVDGKLRSALLVNGSSVTVEGRQIVKSERPVSWTAASLDRARVNVYVGSPDALVSVPDAERAVAVTNTGCDAARECPNVGK